MFTREFMLDLYELITYKSVEELCHENGFTFERKPGELLAKDTKDGKLFRRVSMQSGLSVLEKEFKKDIGIKILINNGKL